MNLYQDGMNSYQGFLEFNMLTLRENSRTFIGVYIRRNYFSIFKNKKVINNNDNLGSYVGTNSFHLGTNLFHPGTRWNKMELIHSIFEQFHSKIEIKPINKKILIITDNLFLCMFLYVSSGLTVFQLYIHINYIDTFTWNVSIWIFKLLCVVALYSHLLQSYLTFSWTD